MGKRKTFFLCLLLLCFGLKGTFGQEAVVPSGGRATGSGGSLSYTVGQVFYRVQAGPVASLSEGVQQPYEIFSVGVTHPGLALSLSAFPNPVAHQLTLAVREFNNEKMRFQLFDLSGKLLLGDRITGHRTQIPMDNFPAGIYLLNIILEKQSVQSFKIIKNQ